jgi:hypothetical protein
MSTRAINQVGDYLAAVRAALSDLPSKERDEAIRDLKAHLSEVVTELGDDASPGIVRRRLGPPETYALQLREAAGYGPPESADAIPAPTARRLLLLVFGYAIYICGVLASAYALLAGRSMLTTLAIAAALLGGLGVTAGLRSGSPAWLRNGLGRDYLVARVTRWPVWVLRAVGANLLLAAFEHHGGVHWDLAFIGPGRGTYQGFGGTATPPWDYFLYWPFFQNIVAFVLLVLSIVASVALGLYGRKRHAWRVLAAPVNLALVLTIGAVYLFGPFSWPMR